ncbi:MAG TPA: XdhC family protein [Actinomycetospora sp.]|jgi:xanthine dehydrogenase accessory factor|uniref:XdhC family protein n=1 Tax=Actinomycetospora sp. TaxID=1872135 RepID=UPI002F42DA11
MSTTGNPNDLLTRVDHLRSDRTPFVLATVVRAERPTSARPGDRAVVLPDGTVEGFVGGACAESTVRLEGLRLLRDGTSTLLRITPTVEDGPVDPPPPVDGVVTVDNPCLSGGTLEIFLEAMVPPTVVVVLGDGPVAHSLVTVGAALDYDVRTADGLDPVDDGLVPPDAAAVVVASHGRQEEPVLTRALRAGVPYVALVASRRRGTAVLGALDPEARVRVHTPAGLDIGARTPPEVALSIYAEIVATRAHRVWPVSTALGAEPEEPAAHAVDPVCGMTVACVPASPSAVVDGSTHWFCGLGCRQAFLHQDGPR